MSKNNVLAARVELLQVSGVAGDFETEHGLLPTNTLLTCNNSTLAAKTLSFGTLFNLSFKSVTRYFAKGF